MSSSPAISERIPLHSATGRLLYAMLYASFYQCLVSVFVVTCLELLDHRFGLEILVILLLCIPAYFASRWARQYCGQIWATERGLEIDSPNRLIPWGEVAQVRYKAFFSALQPFYVIRFKRGSRLAFYACDDVERVVARFTPERDEGPATG